MSSAYMYRDKAKRKILYRHSLYNVHKKEVEGETARWFNFASHAKLGTM